MKVETLRLDALLRVALRFVRGPRTLRPGTIQFNPDRLADALGQDTLERGPVSGQGFFEHGVGLVQADPHHGRLDFNQLRGREGLFEKATDRPGGLKEIEAGLRGLGGWLDYVERYESEGRYWDPGLYLRKEIQRSLAMIESGDINWSHLIARGEQFGREFEEEIDESQKQFQNDLGKGNGGE